MSIINHQLRVYENIVDLIASPENPTPMVRLNKSFNGITDFPIYLKLERYPEARHAFGRCLKILPDYEPVLYYLADMELSLGNNIQAEELYRNIISVNSKSFRAYIAYAGIKANSAKYSDAIEILDRCLDLNPRYRDAINLREELLDEL